MRMNRGMLGKQTEKDVISLDIGRDSIKMLKGIKREGKICLSNFASQKHFALENRPDLLSQDIYELLGSVVDAKKIKRAKIYSTIAGRKLCVRTVKLPVMPEEELYQAVRSKIRKYVSSDLDQVIFSFSVLGETQEKGVRRLEVVFAAIQKKLFDEYLQVFKLADVEPRIVTSACFSGWNLVRETNLDQGASSLMLVNIESHETDLTVYRRGRFIFTRSISTGGRDFIDTLNGQSQLSLDNPRDAKLVWGLGDEADSLEPTKKANVMKVRELLQTEANVLCKEIELTADHYYQIMHGKRIDKCIVLGEYSQIAGLLDFLKERLEVPVEGLQVPDEKLQLFMDKAEEFKKDCSVYTQALGALLVGPKDINLVAHLRRQAKKEMRSIKYFAPSKMTTVAIGVFIFLALSIFLFLKGINFYYQRQIKSYEIRQDKLQNQTMQLMQIKRKMDILDFEKKLYLQLIKEHPAYPVIIAEICQAIPSEEIVLDKLEFSSGQKRARSGPGPSPVKFTITGRVTGEDATGQEATNFVLALEQSGYFENISLTVDRGRGGRLDRREASEQEIERSNFVIDGVLRTNKLEER